MSCPLSFGYDHQGSSSRVCTFSIFGPEHQVLETGPLNVTHTESLVALPPTGTGTAAAGGAQVLPVGS